MRQLSFLIIILIAQTGFAQTVDFDLIDYKGLGFSSSKSEIENALGKPNKIYEPNYDCGALSSEEQGIPFYTLDYNSIKFTGWNNDNYLIKEVIFENDSNVKLNYGQFNLTCETDSSELVNIFGEKLAERLTEDFTGGIVIFHSTNDEGIRLELKKGKLVRWQYWTPC